MISILNNMVRHKSEVWNHFEIDGNKTICKFCNKEAFKNPSRMPVHLTKCTKCPDSIKSRMMVTIAKSSSKKSSQFSDLKTSSPRNVSTSYMEQLEYDDISNIELVNEEDIETSEIFLSDGKYLKVEKLNGKNNKKIIEYDGNVSKKHEDDRITDEFSTFGDCVAHKLRNINNPRVRAVAQYYINSVLFRAEMTNFNEEFSFTFPQEFSLFDKVNKEEENSV